jgi:hypothetical protein
VEHARSSVGQRLPVPYLVYSVCTFFGTVQHFKLVPIVAHLLFGLRCTYQLMCQEWSVEEESGFIYARNGSYVVGSLDLLAESTVLARKPYLRPFLKVGNILLGTLFMVYQHLAPLRTFLPIFYSLSRIFYIWAFAFHLTFSRVFLFAPFSYISFSRNDVDQYGVGDSLSK